MSCSGPSFSTPGPWSSPTMNAGSILLCSAFCVNFNVDTQGASDGLYEGLSIIVPDSSDDLCGQLGFWFGSGNSFGFGVQCQAEWFTPSVYSERKAYSLSFCFDTADKAAKIIVDGDEYTDPSTQGRT